MIVAHSKLTKCQMLDWIKDRIEQGEPSPSDDEIVDRFNLSGVESARVLLSDLADEGAITIRWKEAGRPIDLGPRERRPAASPAPIPSVVRTDQAVDDGVAKIVGIINRGSTKAVRRALKARPVAPSSSSVAPAARPAAPKPALVAPPTVHGAPTLPHLERLPTAPGKAITPAKAKSRQINSKIDEATYNTVASLAKEAGTSTSAMCGMLLSEALTARRGNVETPSGKPLLRAAVLRTFQADDREFGEFLTYLIDLGLASYESGKIAEAAS